MTGVEEAVLESTPGYIDLVQSVMTREKVSMRELHRRTRLSRHRLRAIFDSGDMTVTEQDLVFSQLGIDAHHAFLAIKQYHDVDAYYDPIVCTTASFSEHLARKLRVEQAARSGDFEPLRQSLLDPLAHDIATRVMAHQDRCQANRDKFYG